MSDHLVLVVEDDPADALLALEALESAGAADVRVHVVEDGQCAIDYLFQKVGHERAPTQGLVLLDLHGAGLDRTEILRRVQNDDRLQGVVRLMLTISDGAP